MCQKMMTKRREVPLDQIKVILYRNCHRGRKYTPELYFRAVCRTKLKKYIMRTFVMMVLYVYNFGNEVVLSLINYTYLYTLTQEYGVFN